MRRDIHTIPTEEYCQTLWDGIDLYYFTYIKTNKKIKISTFSRYRSVIAFPIFSSLILILGGRLTIIAPITGISILFLIFLSIYHVEINREKRISNGFAFIIERDIPFLRALILSKLPYDHEDCSEFGLKKKYTVEGLIFQKGDHTCRITLFSRDSKRTLVHFSICDDESSKLVDTFADSIVDLD